MKKTLAALAAGSALLVVACGDDGSSGGATVEEFCEEFMAVESESEARRITPTDEIADDWRDAQRDDDDAIMRVAEYAARNCMSVDIPQGGDDIDLDDVDLDDVDGLGG